MSMFHSQGYVTSAVLLFNLQIYLAGIYLLNYNYLQLKHIAWNKLSIRLIFQKYNQSF